MEVVLGVTVDNALAVAGAVPQGPKDSPRRPEAGVLRKGTCPRVRPVTTVGQTPAVTDGGHGRGLVFPVVAAPVAEVATGRDRVTHVAADRRPLATDQLGPARPTETVAALGSCRGLPRRRGLEGDVGMGRPGGAGRGLAGPADLADGLGLDEEPRGPALEGLVAGVAPGAPTLAQVTPVQALYAGAHAA